MQFNRLEKELEPFAGSCPGYSRRNRNLVRENPHLKLNSDRRSKRNEYVADCNTKKCKSKAILMSFPLVGNLSDSPLEKGVSGLFFRRIADKPQ